MASEHEDPLFCDRCVCQLYQGQGSFYVVSIDAVADPTGPTFSDDDLRRDVGKELDELVEQLENVSPQEAMDQVHRSVQLTLCLSCYQEWIENPTSS